MADQQATGHETFDNAIDSRTAFIHGKSLLIVCNGIIFSDKSQHSLILRRQRRFYSVIYSVNFSTKIKQHDNQQLTLHIKIYCNHFVE